MLHFLVLTFLALACASTQLLNSLSLDDTSNLGLDQGELGLDPIFDENWSTSSSYDLDAILDKDSNLFAEPETDPSDHLWEDNASLSPSGEGGGGGDADMIAIATACQSNPTQASKLRNREAEDQCFNTPPAKIAIEEMVNEQIKRKWCSRIPWVGFGNIPVTRFTESFIFPVQPGALPDVPSTAIPLSGYFNVLKAALRKWIIPARSCQRNESRHD